MANIVADHLERDIRIHQALYTTVPEGVGARSIDINASSTEILTGSLRNTPVRDRGIGHHRCDKECPVI